MKRSGRVCRSRAAIHRLSLIVLGISISAQGGGLFFSDRGVRPLGRGGAFVAGADDLSSFWYNPAGLADAGNAILSDFSWMHFTDDFTRQALVSDAGGTLYTVDFPTVSGTTPFLPIPTLGLSRVLGRENQWTIAGGVNAPYAALTSYPQTIQSGVPAPSRYSLVSLDGTALAILGAYVAYKPIELVRIGLGLQALVGTFNSTVVFTTNPADRLIGAPEDPQYDSLSQVKASPVFAPSANLGVTLVPNRWLRIGASGQLPFVINAPATVTVRLPNAPEFDNAQQVGDKAHVKMKLPGILRLGVEVSPFQTLRLEVSYVLEFWSAHHSIDIVPDNITLTGVTGFPSPYVVPPISIPRNFRNSNSVRIGGEYSGLQLFSWTMHLRAGFNWDQSAIPDAYLSPLTVDLNKYTASLGGGIEIAPHWRLDAVYAHIFGGDVSVPPSQAAVPRINPVKGNPVSVEAINGGHYSARADIFGGGFNFRF